MSIVNQLREWIKNLFNAESARVPSLSYASAQRMRMATRFMAVTLSTAIVGTSITSSAQAFGPVAAGIPDFVHTFTPPSRLGYVDSYYKGSTEHPVVLIEDLHANYGVQKNIEGMLSQIQVKQGDKSMVIGIEGYEGKADLSYLDNINPRILKPLLDVALKEAEATAAGHFAALSQKPVELYGVDSREDYALNLSVVRESMVARLNLADRVDALTTAMDKERKHAPKALRNFWKTEKAFHDGQIDLPELTQYLGNKTAANYGAAEKALYQKGLELASTAGDQSAYWSKFVRADQNLQLLSRLFRQELTLEEVQYVSQQIPDILEIVKALRPMDNVDEWKSVIEKAVDYYVVALMRDHPLSENTFKLAQMHPDQAIAVVTGGFHTAAITNYLKSKNQSYVVLAPIVKSHTLKDEELYLTRLMGIHDSAAKLAGLTKERMVVQTNVEPTAVPPNDPTAVTNLERGAEEVQDEVPPSSSGDTPDALPFLVNINPDLPTTEGTYDVASGRLNGLSGIDQTLAQDFINQSLSTLQAQGIATLHVRFAPIPVASGHGIAAHTSVNGTEATVTFDPSIRTASVYGQRLRLDQEEVKLARGNNSISAQEEADVTSHSLLRVIQHARADFAAQNPGSVASADVVITALTEALRDFNTTAEGTALTAAVLSLLRPELEANNTQQVEVLISQFAGGIVALMVASTHGPEALGANLQGREQASGVTAAQVHERISRIPEFVNAGTEAARQQLAGIMTDLGNFLSHTPGVTPEEMQRSQEAITEAINGAA